MNFSESHRTKLPEITRKYMYDEPHTFYHATEHLVLCLVVTNSKWTLSFTVKVPDIWNLRIIFHKKLVSFRPHSPFTILIMTRNTPEDFRITFDLFARNDWNERRNETQRFADVTKHFDNGTLWRYM